VVQFEGLWGDPGAFVYDPGLTGMLRTGIMAGRGTIRVPCCRLTATTLTARISVVLTAGAYLEALIKRKDT
jgi:hypothetical protein